MIIFGGRDENQSYDILNPKIHSEAVRNKKAAQDIERAVQIEHKLAQLKIENSSPDNVDKVEPVTSSMNVMNSLNHQSPLKNLKYIRKTGFIESLHYLPTRGYKACWPYVTFSGFAGNLWIFNAFDPGYIMRVEPPCSDLRDKKNRLRVLNTFITVDKHLYVIMISRIAKDYQMWRIDLDKHRVGLSDNNRHQKLDIIKIFSYSFTDV